MAKGQLSERRTKHSPRTHRYVFTLNEEENRALLRYIKRYNVQNSARFLRETVMLAVIRKFEEDHPTLF